jgi:hypothetical protein
MFGHFLSEMGHGNRTSFISQEIGTQFWVPKEENLQDQQ